MPALFPRPLVLGHRGAPREAPENTLRAFALALEQGADGVELDVRLARDGTPVVIHDATLERTFPARGAVAAHDWPALERLTGARLPSLEQVAAWAAASGAWLNVELKARAAEAATLALLQRTGLLERCVLSSFHAETVAEVGRIAPGATRFLLAERWDAAAREGVRASAAHGVCLGVAAATPAALRELDDAGLPVIAWTVDDPARMRELLRAGVAGLITDLPALAVEIRREGRAG